jgi:hypothetical protein
MTSGDLDGEARRGDAWMVGPATMESFTLGDLRIDMMEVDEPPAVRLLWQGKSNDRQPDKVLGPIFAGALDRVTERKAPLELHFESLEHFNSSTITSLIQLIQEARGRGARLVVVFDPQRKWQKLSFDALRVFVKADGLFELRAASA